MYTLHLKIVIVINLLTSLRCARILAIFPGPAISHQIVFRPITQELARRGHEVVVITPNPAFSGQEAPDNLIEIDIGNASYAVWDKVVFNDATSKNRDVVPDVFFLTRALFKVFEAAMETPAVKEIIRKKEHYDLLLTEHGMEVSLGFSHIIKAPVIQISSLGHLFFSDKSVGSDVHPFLYPCPMNQRVYNLTKFEKIQTIWNGLKLVSAFKVLNRETDVIIKKIFGQDTPSFYELKENIHMTMLNVHPIWIDNQPLSPNVILIGGIHENLPTPLPQDLQEHLDSSKNGTIIYVSFGSKATLSSFTPETVKILLGVLCNLPFDVLLRWEEDKLPADCRNIKVSKWFPQADVLRHPKVKLFITQGGLQSTDEAITGGVPLIGVPIMGDQYYNSEKYVRHGIGKKLDWYDFEARAFRDAIEEVLNNVSYHDNIIRLRTLMKDSPHSPLERAVWWAEYVLRHGGARHLRPPTAHITLYEYLEIDLLIYIILWFIIYYINIVRLRTLMKDSPYSPLERAVWWAEYVLRHGGARHLRPPTAHITLYEYLELDLLIYIILWFIMSVGVIVITVFIVIKYGSRRLGRKEKLF